MCTYIRMHIHIAASITIYNYVFYILGYVYNEREKHALFASSKELPISMVSDEVLAI